MNKLLLKAKQRFRSENHNVSAEVINKIALNWNGNKKNITNWFDRNICIWN